MNPNWACLCKEIYQSFSLCRKRFRKDHCEIYQCPSRFNKVHHLLHGTAFLFLSGFLWKSMVRIIHFHRGSWNVILSSRLFPVKRFVKIPSCELISQSPSWDSQTSIQMLELKPIFHWCLFSVKRFSKVHRDIFLPMIEIYEGSSCFELHSSPRQDIHETCSMWRDSKKSVVQLMRAHLHFSKFLFCKKIQIRPSSYWWKSFKILISINPWSSFIHCEQSFKDSLMTDKYIDPDCGAS